MAAARPASLLFGAVILAGFGIVGCSSNTGPKEAVGTVAGTGVSAGNTVGGAAGNAVGDAAGGNRVNRTLAEAAPSGFLGNRIGAALDDDDKRRAYAAQMQALETGPSGAPVAWRNPDSGRYGNVVPGPVYQLNGASCRQYTHTVYIDGQPQTERGTACRKPDGTWSIMS